MPARSKAQVFGRSPAEIVASNPTGGMAVCCDCCVLSGRGLCDGMIPRLEESYRLVCRVWSRNLVNEEARPSGGCCAKRNYWAIVGPKLSGQPEDPDYRMTTILCLTHDITASLLKFPRSNSFEKNSKWDSLLISKVNQDTCRYMSPK